MTHIELGILCAEVDKYIYFRGRKKKIPYCPVSKQNTSDSLKCHKGENDASATHIGGFFLDITAPLGYSQIRKKLIKESEK